MKTWKKIEILLNAELKMNKYRIHTTETTFIFRSAMDSFDVFIQVLLQMKVGLSYFKNI